VVKADPLRLAEAFPRRRTPRHLNPAPSDAEIARARQVMDTHVGSMITYICLAEGCSKWWPCRPYRKAEATLRDAGAPPSDANPPARSTCYSGCEG
jgi:hypothetical protein